MPYSNARFGKCAERFALYSFSLNHADLMSKGRKTLASSVRTRAYTMNYAPVGCAELENRSLVVISKAPGPACMAASS